VPCRPSHGDDTQVRLAAERPELRRDTLKPNRMRAKRAKVMAAGVVAWSESFGGVHRSENRRLAWHF
jgi:hypothetical protein